jgi:cation diffusion facilitator family transporter
VKQEITPNKVIKTSLTVNILDILFNGVVAIITGSSVMLAGTLRGLSDLITVIFLYIGIKRSAKRPNKKFNFGYGRELYFWVLCAAITMFVVSASISFYSGLIKFLNPEPLERTIWAYLVLTVGIITNTYSLSFSYRKIKSAQTKASIIKNFTSSRLLEIKTALITDLMGSVSVLLGIVALIIYGMTGDARYDGLGAMIIALAISSLALILIFEAKEMIIGKSVPPGEKQTIRKIAEMHPLVNKVLQITTMHFGSEEMYVNLNINVKDNLKTQQIENLINEIKENIIKLKPEVKLPRQESGASSLN